MPETSCGDNFTRDLHRGRDALGPAGRFWETIFLPYLVGGILPGLIVSLLFYYLTIPVVHAYQKIRAGKLRERIEKRHADRDARRAKAP
jgi:uncharacterized protein